MISTRLQQPCLTIPSSSTSVRLGQRTEYKRKVCRNQDKGGLKLKDSAERDKSSLRRLFLVEQIFNSGAVTHLTVFLLCGRRNNINVRSLLTSKKDLVLYWKVYLGFLLFLSWPLISRRVLCGPGQGFSLLERTFSCCCLPSLQKGPWSSPPGWVFSSFLPHSNSPNEQKPATMFKETLKNRSHFGFDQFLNQELTPKWMKTVCVCVCVRCVGVCSTV